MIELHGRLELIQLHVEMAGLVLAAGEDASAHPVADRLGGHVQELGGKRGGYLPLAIGDGLRNIAQRLGLIEDPLVFESGDQRVQLVELVPGEDAGNHRSSLRPQP